MTQEVIKQAVLNVSTATAELVTKILAQFPHAHVQPRSVPISDEDVSLEVSLPGSMADIYQARDWLYDLIIELQERYDIIIMVSAVPQEK